jgi:fatty acyl-ACP thioesterase B
MMNKHTRKLSKIPEEVREEIGSYFVESAPILEEDDRKLTKLDDSTADYIRSGLSVCLLCCYWLIAINNLFCQLTLDAVS